MITSASFAFHSFECNRIAFPHGTSHRTTCWTAFVLVSLCLFLLFPVVWTLQSDAGALQQALYTPDLNEAMIAFLSQWQKVHSNVNEHTQTRLKFWMAESLNRSSFDTSSSTNSSAFDSTIDTQKSLLTSKKRKSRSADDSSALSSSVSQSNAHYANCSRCLDHKHARLKRLHEIKNEILTRLSMTEPPLIEANHSFPPNITFDFDKWMPKDEPYHPFSASGDDEPFYVNTKRTLTFAISRT